MVKILYLKCYNQPNSQNLAKIIYSGLYSKNDKCTTYTEHIHKMLYPSGFFNYNNDFTHVKIKGLT